MSSVHCVVVWEFESGGQWVPHTPGVTRTLERAHAKRLTRVVLADADPALHGHHVNLRTLTQSQDMPDGSLAECAVRRACYSVHSVGGRGARWEWARLSSPPHPAELHYEPMPMEMQCAVEEAWCGGSEQVSWRGWSVAVRGGLARRGAAVRVLRRAPQPPYPRARTPAPAPAPAPAHVHALDRNTASRARIPQQHTGSSVHSVQSTRSAPPAPPAPPARCATPPPAPPAAHAPPAPRDRKHNLARQILHNLNIFSNNNNKQMSVSPTRADGDAHRPRESHPDRDQCCTRRHSVDTVSTYLSHESKDSVQRGSMGELLNCSGGSDDVFESPPPTDADADADADDPSDDDVIDVAGAGVGLCPWARPVSRPQWGAVCPVCLGALGAGGAGGAGGRAVSLAACQHMLHLRCLHDQLRAAADRAARHSETVYIECLVCGRAYGAPPAPAPLAPPASLAPLAPAGAQPPGSMAWRLQHAALPQCTTDTAILVTYNFQSGVQGPRDPAPGLHYYAVGFPRHSLLPDDDLGRQVLSGLRAAWSRGLLFAVRASRTTGREHVVAWRSERAPPPAAAHHYLPPARPALLLRRALAHLHQLMHHTS